ncbi:MAG: D-aminoacyl-tRNA deacylase [Planctomycetota bacterium]
MRIVVQRVRHGRVELPVEARAAGEIGQGLVLLVGVQRGDDAAVAEWCARKLAGLRIFEDGGGKMNLSIAEVAGARVLAVPNFTVGCDIGRGRRPSFDAAMAPEAAEGLFEGFVATLRDEDIAVETGVFGAEIRVELVNDGPVTFVIEHPR